MNEHSKPDPSVKLDSTLSKGLQILELLAQSKDSKGVTEISRELGLTKSNVFRLLQTLAALGYVKHAPDKQYLATLKAWRVGRKVVDNLDLRGLAGEEMQSLSRDTLEAIYLAVPEGLSVVYIDKIDSRQPIRSWNPIGGTAPIHCVGTGKSILAVNYDTMRDQLIGNLTRYTDKTITNMKDLDLDISKTNSRGYAVDVGEFRERIFSIGAAICLPDGQAIAALGISVPDVNLPVRGEEKFGALVKEAAQSVSARITSL